MKTIVWLIVVLSLLCGGCGYEPDDNSDVILPSESYLDDPFVGGFTYNKADFFLEKEVTPMIDNYYISYRHKDGTIERLVDYVEANATWRVIDDKLYFSPGNGLSVLTLSDKSISAMVFPKEAPHYDVTNILDVQDQWLYCGGIKYKELEDEDALPGLHVVETRLFVKLDFSDFYEEDADA